MGCCFVPHCNHRKGCRFFRFPRDAKKLKIWINLIRRVDAVPNYHSRICCCHFVDGDKTKNPTIFPWNVNKRLDFPSLPEKRRRTSSKPRNPDMTDNSRKEVPNQRAEETPSAEIDSARTENELSGAQLERGDGVCTEIQLWGIQLKREDGVYTEDELLGGQMEQDDEVWTEKELLGGQLEREDRVRAENERLQLEVEKLTVENESLKHEVARLHELSAENEQLIACEESLRSEVKRLSEQLDENRILQENKQLTNEVQLLKQQLLQANSIMYEAENYLLKSEVKKLETELNESKDVFLFRKIADKNELTSHFTGLPNKETFYALLKLFDDFDIQFVKKWKVTRFNKENQLFICLLKLRRGLSDLDLATRFKVYPTTIANIFISWVLALHRILVQDHMTDVLSRFQKQANLPEWFRTYPNTRMILDCTEVGTDDNPSLFKKKSQTYYNIKNTKTSKALVGVAPHGAVVFASDLFPGSTSDQDVVVDSGVLKCLVTGDSVMADVGFDIDELLPDGVALLNIPTARTHVKKAIDRIKVFTILQFIPQKVEPYASEIFQVCAALTNFRGPTITDISSKNDE